MTWVVGVTGASGYLGRALVRRLQDDGHHVVVIGRSPARGAMGYRNADIAQLPVSGLTDGLDALIHLAADTSGGNALPPGTELRFAETLARQATAAGCVFVFVSSQTASMHAPSGYGQRKAAIEAAVLPLGATVVRPGLVYGGEVVGLYGTLSELVRRLPVIPGLRPRPKVQPVHVDDVAVALIAAARAPWTRGHVVSVAGPPLSFDTFLSAIAHHRMRRRRVVVPVPTLLLRVLLLAGGRLLGPRFSAERLDSLLDLPPMETEADLKRLGIVLRGLPEGLAGSSWQRRLLLEEAQALERALLGRCASPGLLRRYVRALAAHGVVVPLSLGRSLPAAWMGALDAMHERVDAPVGSLPWRLATMTRLAESEPTLAHAFVQRAEKASLPRTLGDLALACILEARNRLLAPLARMVHRS